MVFDCSSTSVVSRSRSAKQHRDLRGFFVGRNQAFAGRTQFANHIDQRNAIDAARQSIEPAGRFGIAQRAEFLHFAQADRKHIREGLLVDIAQQRSQQMGTRSNSFGRGERNFAFHRPAASAMPREEEFSAGRSEMQHPPREGPLPAARYDWRRWCGKTIQHAAQKLHERGLAGFVGAVEDRQIISQLDQAQIVPNSKSVYLAIGDSHVTFSDSSTLYCRGATALVFGN